MSGGQDPRDADFDDASEKLNEGLKSCRSVLDNYRAKLSGGRSDHGAAANDDERTSIPRG